MVHVGQVVWYGVSTNSVHLIVASVLGWAFVAGTVAVWGVAEIGRGRYRGAHR